MESKVVNKSAVVEQKVKTQRNGLIELYRFLFALWVVYYHSFFVVKTNQFNHGYIAVEFFFILSGFYLLRSIDKFINQPFWSGLGKFCWSRLKTIMLPFAVGCVFAIWFMILDKEITMLGYLWYVPFMFIAFAVIYLCRKLVKNQTWFIVVLAGFVAVSYLVLYLPLLKGWGFFRGLGGVSLGVLVSLVPKCELKLKKFNFNWLIAGAIFLTILFLAYQDKTNLISEYFLVLLLIPALIYFSNTLSLHSKVLNFLGSIAFGLYAYQCILRVIDWYVPLEKYYMFIILVAFTLAGEGCEWLMGKVAKNKQLKTNG